MPLSRRSVDAALTTAWQRRGVVASLLLPIALVFALLVPLRRLLYRLGVFRVHRVPVPVVVIGNITVGGVGKTPLVIFLANTLKLRGFHPGIVSRGHAGSGQLLSVDENADPDSVGDEPLLLRRKSGCPVVIGRDRVAAARYLLAQHPTVATSF